LVLVATGTLRPALGARLGAAAALTTLFVWLFGRLGLRELPPGRFDRAIAPPAPVVPPRPADLERLERLVRPNLTAAETHFDLRPVLRDLAAHRLRAGHGIELDRDPARARQLLGESLFELVRADRPIPNDRQARNAASAQEAIAFVHTLEAL
jgi:hypothetical protein